MTSSDYPGSAGPPGSRTGTDTDDLTSGYASSGPILGQSNGSDGGTDAGAKDQLKQAAGTAGEQARSTADTAAEEGKHVAGVAMGEAQHVAAEAKAQTQNVITEAVHQVQEQSRAQRDRLVETLRTFGDDLEQMASQGGRSGVATDLARQVAGRTRDISSHLDGREPSDLVEDLRSFARRKPGMFLLGAVTAGVVAGRATRGVKEATGSQTGTGTSGEGSGVYDAPLYDDPRATPGRTAAGAPPAGTEYPTRGPGYPTPGAASPEAATTYSSDPEVAAESWVDDPTRRGPL